MLRQISEYFVAEKQESLLFLLAALVAIGLSYWLWFYGHRLKTMAIPLVSIALIQLVVGGTVLLRTDSQIERLSQLYQTAPTQFKTEEVSRMEVVMKNFSTYKIIEVSLLCVGMLLIVFMQRVDIAAGIGAGLVLQSALMLTLDVFAESRGNDYLNALRAMTG